MSDQLSRLCAVAGGLLLLAVVACAFLARMQVHELRTIQFGTVTWYVFYGSVAATAVVWTAAGLRGRELLRRIDTQGLATIALISGLQCIALYASRVLFVGPRVFIGPFADYLQEFVDKGLFALLSAILIVLLPLPGTITLSRATVFLLNAIFLGSFGLSSLVFISTTILFHEGFLAAFGLTVGPTLRRPAIRPTQQTVLRMALALGLANACGMYVQYTLFRVLLRQSFFEWYVISVCLVAGLGGGGIGAALGTLLGYRLRRTAP